MPSDNDEEALRRRIGTFWVSNELLYGVLYGEGYVSELARVFELLAFIPLASTDLFPEGEDVTEMTGISKLFDIVTKGEGVPFYVIHIHTTWDEEAVRHRVSRVQVTRTASPRKENREASLQNLIKEFGRG